MAVGYLSQNALARCLEQGRTVEQWLGTRVERGDEVLKWASIERLRAGNTIVRVLEVWNEGNPDFLDVYEFTPYDADAESGTVVECDSSEQALQYVLSRLGGNREHFVQRGGIQDIYAEHLERRVEPSQDG